MYLVEVLGKLSDAFATVDGLSAFHYYGSAIENGLDLGSCAVLIVAGVLLAARRLPPPRAAGRGMSLRPVAAMLALALAVGAAHEARAVGGWSITEAGPGVAPAGPVSIAPDGRVLAARSACEATTCSTTLVTHAPGGAFERAGAVPGQLQASAPLRAGAALLVTSPLSSRGLTAFDVTAAGVVARTASLAGRHASGTVAASDRRGTAAVAWMTSSAPLRLRVRVRRRDGGAFGPARTVASFRRADEFGNAALAVGPRGEVAVLWASGGALHMRALRRGARRLGPALRAGRSDRVARISAAYTTGGTLAAIWSSADGGQEQDREAVVRVAALRPGAARFSRGRRLSAGADRETLLSASGSGRAGRRRGPHGERRLDLARPAGAARHRSRERHGDGGALARPPRRARGRGRLRHRARADRLDPRPARAGRRARARCCGSRRSSWVPPSRPGRPARARRPPCSTTRRPARRSSWSAATPLLPARWGIAERRAP